MNDLARIGATDQCMIMKLIPLIKRRNSWFWIVAFIVMPYVQARSQTIRLASEWTHLSPPPAKINAVRWVRPVSGELFRLDSAILRAKLAGVARAEPSSAKSNGSEMELPMPDGTTARFIIVEAPVMA